PLDALEMVGMLEMDGIKWALIVSNERMIYRARQGDYIGENDGKIVDISEEQIDIMELLPDGKGCWTYELTSIRAFSK
ncbi:MAG: pilus assembly protein PilP, partial [Thiomargarita sp.]|nr:pilus assembly protein PilP [Thiomargarita sp.]